MTVLPFLLPNAASALRTPSYSGEDGREVVRASVRDRGVALERRVAPTRRPALLPACPASPSSATEPATQDWCRRWWGLLTVAVRNTLATHHRPHA